MLLIVYRRIPIPHAQSIPYAATRERLGTIEAIQSYCCDMVSEWKLKKQLGWTLKQRIMIKNLLHLSWWFWNDTILGLHLDFCGRWQELYNWSHPSTMAPSHALKLIDWRSSPRPSCFLSSYTENLLISQRTGFIHIISYGMIWNWHGNGSIIILAGGSRETFSYLRVLLSAGYWRISN